MKKQPTSGGKIFALLVLISLGLVAIIYFFWPDRSDIFVDVGSLELGDSSSRTQKKQDQTVASADQAATPTPLVPEKKFEDAQSLKLEVEKVLRSSEEFLRQCEMQMDKELQEFIALDLKQIVENENLAWEKLNSFNKIQHHNQALSQAYVLLESHPQFIDDDWMIDHSPQMRPCRPFMAIEFWSRMMEGLGQKSWSTEFEEELRRSLMVDVRATLAMENRVFTTGLYVNLLKQMYRLRLLPAESEADLKRLEGQVEDFSESVRTQLESIDDRDEVKGAGKLLLLDLQEGRKIKEELLQLLQDVSLAE